MQTPEGARSDRSTPLLKTSSVPCQMLEIRCQCLLWDVRVSTDVVWKSSLCPAVLLFSVSRVSRYR